MGGERWATAKAVRWARQPVTLTRLPDAGRTSTELAEFAFSVETTLVLKRDSQGKVHGAEVTDRSRSRDAEL
ncbi:hypothetical protein QBC98_003351 [Kitasatospora acidiphila]